MAEYVTHDVRAERAAFAALQAQLDAICTRLERKLLRRAIWAGALSAFVLTLPLYLVVGLALVRMVQGR